MVLPGRPHYFQWLWIHSTTAMVWFWLHCFLCSACFSCSLAENPSLAQEPILGPTIWARAHCKSAAELLFLFPPVQLRFICQCHICTHYLHLVQSLSRVLLFLTLWTVACQAPLSLGLSKQEHWSGFSFPSPGDPPNPGIEPVSSALAGRFFTTQPPGKPPRLFLIILFLNFWGVEGLLFLFFFFWSGCAMHIMWDLSSLMGLNPQPLNCQEVLDFFFFR